MRYTERIDGFGTKKSDEIVESLYDRILGRVALFDIEDPSTNEVIVKEGEEINEDLARAIEAAGIEELKSDPY